MVVHGRKESLGWLGCLRGFAGFDVTSLVLKIMHASVSKINCGHVQEKMAGHSRFAEVTTVADFVRVDLRKQP